MSSSLQFFKTKIRIRIFYLFFGIFFATQNYAQKVKEVLVIENVESINTKTLEYCPIIYKDQIVFTSTRPTAGRPMTSWRDEKKQFSDLYMMDKSGYGGFYNAKRLRGKANSPVFDGIATFDKKGTKMFFTRSNQKGKNINNIVNLKIYVAELKNNIWQEVQELPFNHEEYSHCHPSLSADGNKLYLAANRPEGFGGMDLYVSRKVNGIWQKPKNLGPTINTSNNEVFPFIRENGELYFASNNDNSLGGLDIFVATPTEQEDIFENAENLGADFNSERDDFGFFAFPNKEEGYFSSNRVGGKGGDDIYSWKRNTILLAKPKMHLSLYDSRTHESISEALVTVFDEGITSTRNDIYPISKLVAQNGTNANNPYLFIDKSVYRSGVQGLVSVAFKEGKSYTIFVEKEGYLPVKKVVTAKELTNENKLNFPLHRKAGTPLNVKVVSMPFRENIPYVTLELLNHCNQKTERAISDKNGNFTFYLACDCDYEVVGKKEAYRSYNKKFSTKYRDCGNLSSINTKFYLVEEELAAQISNDKTQRFTSFDAFQSNDSRREGQIVQLSQMQFEENKATLTPSVEQELFNLHYFLKQYPEVIVEIGVHTDSRGTAKFNHRLSQERADLMETFLIEKGIGKERFIAIGYGEDRLLNHCTDGVQCSDAEHLQNKRTEFKITKINSAYLKADDLIGQR